MSCLAIIRPVLLTVLWGAISTSAFAQVEIPQRVDSSLLGQFPYSSVGLTDTVIGPSAYRGSASVALDPRLIFTCAHIAFESGRWADSLRFARAWNSRFDAPGSSYTTMRGYRFFATYASDATRFPDSNVTFGSDFVVGFNTSPVGPALPVSENGVTALSSYGFEKRILGYPAERDWDGRTGDFFMHQTGPFLGGLSQVEGSYYDIEGVSTGSGNSGGPVLDSSSGTPVLSAILVAGSRAGAGVYVLGADSRTLAANALASLESSGAGGQGDSSVGSGTANDQTLLELELAYNRLYERLLRVRRIPNARVRAIQLRRTLIALITIERQILAIESGS